MLAVGVLALKLWLLSDFSRVFTVLLSRLGIMTVLVEGLGHVAAVAFGAGLLATLLAFPGGVLVALTAHLTVLVIVAGL